MTSVLKIEGKGGTPPTRDAHDTRIHHPTSRAFGSSSIMEAKRRLDMTGPMRLLLAVVPVPAVYCRCGMVWERARGGREGSSLSRL
jgi:hypothetical protein